MIGRLLFYAGRFTAAAIFLTTWGYGVTTFSRSPSTCSCARGCSPSW